LTNSVASKILSLLSSYHCTTSSSHLSLGHLVPSCVLLLSQLSIPTKSVDGRDPDIGYFVRSSMQSLQMLVG
jgi:hypothetical protein